MLHVLECSSSFNLGGSESPGILEMPSKTWRFGKQEKTLQTRRNKRQGKVELRRTLSSSSIVYGLSLLTVRGSPE